MVRLYGSRYMFLKLLRSTVKAANGKFISFMSFEIITFIHWVFSSFDFDHYLTNVARISIKVHRLYL